MKFSARIHPSSVRASVSSAYWGEKLYSYDARIDLFSAEPRQMVILSEHFFIRSLRLLLGTLKSWYSPGFTTKSPNYSKQRVISSPQKSLQDFNVPSSNLMLHTSPRWRNFVIGQPSVLVLLKIAPFQHHSCTTFPPVGGDNTNSRAREVNSSAEFHLHIIKILSHVNREKVYRPFSHDVTSLPRAH